MPLLHAGRTGSRLLLRAAASGRSRWRRATRWSDACWRSPAGGVGGPRFGSRTNSSVSGGHCAWRSVCSTRIQQELGVEAGPWRPFHGSHRGCGWPGSSPAEPRRPPRPGPRWCRSSPRATGRPSSASAGSRVPPYLSSPAISERFSRSTVSAAALAPDGSPLDAHRGPRRVLVDALRSVSRWAPGTSAAGHSAPWWRTRWARRLQERGARCGWSRTSTAPGPVRLQRLTPCGGRRRMFYDVACATSALRAGRSPSEDVAERRMSHGRRGRARFQRVVSPRSLRSLVEGAAIASVVPRESAPGDVPCREIRANAPGLAGERSGHVELRRGPLRRAVTLFRDRAPSNGASKRRARGWGEVRPRCRGRWIPATT